MPSFRFIIQSKALPFNTVDIDVRTLATGWGCWNQRKGPNGLLAPMVWPFARLSFPLFSEISPSNIEMDAALRTETGCLSGAALWRQQRHEIWSDSDRALKKGKMLKLMTDARFALLLRCQWCETPCSDQQSLYLFIRSRKQYSWSLLSWVFG